MKTAPVNHALSADPVKQVNVTRLNQTSPRGKQPVTRDREEGLHRRIPEMLPPASRSSPVVGGASAGVTEKTHPTETIGVTAHLMCHSCPKVSNIYYCCHQLCLFAMGPLLTPSINISSHEHVIKYIKTFKYGEFYITHLITAQGDFTYIGTFRFLTYFRITHDTVTAMLCQLFI